ncbi:hypothetical protein ACJX0J_023870, partial [Zea mays]
IIRSLNFEIRLFGMAGRLWQSKIWLQGGQHVFSRPNATVEHNETIFGDYKVVTGNNFLQNYFCLFYQIHRLLLRIISLLATKFIKTHLRNKTGDDFINNDYDKLMWLDISLFAHHYGAFNNITILVLGINVARKN